MQASLHFALLVENFSGLFETVTGGDSIPFIVDAGIYIGFICGWGASYGAKRAGLGCTHSTGKDGSVAVVPAEDAFDQIGLKIGITIDKQISKARSRGKSISDAISKVGRANSADQTGNNELKVVELDEHVQRMDRQ